jgi:hypothetical protein
MTHAAKTDTHCPACARPIPPKMWKNATQKPGQAWETLRCLCGAMVTREVRP